MASWCRNKVDMYSGVCEREAGTEEIRCEKDQEPFSGNHLITLADAYLRYLGNIINGCIYIEYCYLYEDRIPIA